MCACNKGVAKAQDTKFQLLRPDGTTQTFSTKPDAEAARTMAGGGVVTKI